MTRRRGVPLGDALFGALTFAMLVDWAMRPGAADIIASHGRLFLQSIRVAQGLPAEPGPDELIDRAVARFMVDPECDVAGFEAELDERLGLQSRVKGSRVDGAVRRLRDSARRLASVSRLLGG